MHTPLIATRTFYDNDLHLIFNSYGYCVYKNVLIVWDRDHDPRVLSFIDQLSDEVREKLVLAGEYKATLTLYWEDLVPDGYEVDSNVEVEDDSWWIVVSRKLGGAGQRLNPKP